MTKVMQMPDVAVQRYGVLGMKMAFRSMLALAWILVRALPAGAQTGPPLPSGFYHVVNNQIVSKTGVNVRLSCIGYDEPTGNWFSDMKKVRAAGFGCVRYSWFDAITCPSEGCNFTVLDSVVTSAAANDLKVIFSHHGNEGVNGRSGNAACANQQENGLWYDVNDSAVIAGVTWNTLTGNYDGCGTAGTVTYARFKANSVALARRFAGNSTVIGFDLWNEPIVGRAGNCGNACQATVLNWGGGNGSDLRLMCSDTGTAVEAADPNVLIICEGAINFTGKFLNGIQMPPGANGIQELTLAGRLPVGVGASEVVYSTHHYPGWLSGQRPDAGQASVGFMNQAWGFLVTERLAPVWIGEIGASLDGTNGRAKQLEEMAWATTLVSYLNGEQGANGGPTFSEDEQPIGSDWWYFGFGPGQEMNGIYTNHQLTVYNSHQKAYWTALQYRPPAMRSARQSLPLGRDASTNTARTSR